MNHEKSPCRFWILLLCLGLALCGAGCMVGLDYFHPEEDAAQDPEADRVEAAEPEVRPDEGPPDLVDGPVTCGNGAVEAGEECDDGNLDGLDGCGNDCRFTCHGSGECNDENPCTDDICTDGGNGKLCSHVPATGPCDDGNPCTTDDRCGMDGLCTGEPVGCTDEDPCTRDFCDPAAGGCVSEPLPVWFIDGDGDGYGYPSEVACADEQPEGFAGNRDDCCDLLTEVNPGQAEYFPEPYRCGSDSVQSFDYNCNGEDEQRWTESGFCDGSCTLHEGWQHEAVPGCGQTAAFVSGCNVFMGNCVMTIDAMRRQPCR
jgi:cysteine-rich repeat protein